MRTNKATDPELRSRKGVGRVSSDLKFGETMEIHTVATLAGFGLGMSAYDS